METRRELEMEGETRETKKHNETRRQRDWER